ncbi:SDR family NAD(P)-dependent oxidoreductase [Desulfoluna butyratoxydans]|uniref:Short-chain dehydrogenase/reductase sdr n=1 Tax=Desulfoluna butyratoxydans TaxID=231438 RepID=A0A4U8YT72_9BACT|nr:SDR family NAD(P)-dependent oxidoreductase [Desulfoluna butyratoxydans]VFQ46747.1 short-chain dehydrogenase/reductase sdr [Desulfoluna butyratoxydans]
MKRIVLITGCSSGIGEALAQNFLKAGWTVYATARKRDALTPLVSLGAQPVALDLTAQSSVSEAVEHVLGREGHMDMLINNAGYGAMGPLAEMPVDEVRRQFEANLFGQIALIQAVVPAMIQRGAGHIINIGSVSGILPTPFSGAYAASKAAFHAASDALRLELAPFGIKVVIVQPGGIASRFSANAEAQLKETTKNLNHYAASMDAIVRRTRISQESAMPLDRFAEKLTAILLREPIPPVIRLGTHSTLMPFLKKWVPTQRRDAILMKKFKLN